MFYAGIGSRSTPWNIIGVMASLSAALEESGWTLRSGGAKGADEAFEKGVKARAEVYIPWQGFGSKVEPLSGGGFYKLASKQLGWEEALNTVQQYHPAAHLLSNAGLYLMARNAMQILGGDLKTPSSFVVCWTPKGLLKGGTAQALRIAIDNSIPIYNLACQTTLDRVQNYLETGEHFYEI